MSPVDPLRLANTLPVVLVPIIANIGGYPTGIVPLCLSMLAVLAARALYGFNDKTPGALRRELMRALLAAILVFAYDLNYNPGPGFAVLVGGGIGVAIVPILDLIGGRAVDALNRMIGPSPPVPPTPVRPADAGYQRIPQSDQPDKDQDLIDKLEDF